MIVASGSYMVKLKSLAYPEYNAILTRKELDKHSINIIKYKIVWMGALPGLFFGIARPT